MDVTVTEAKNRLTQLLRAVENGERVVITRNGKPVAGIGPPPKRGKVEPGGMRGRIQLLSVGTILLVSMTWSMIRDRYLLDTNIVLVALHAPEGLTPKALKLLPKRGLAH